MASDMRPTGSWKAAAPSVIADISVPVATADSPIVGSVGRRQRPERTIGETDQDGADDADRRGPVKPARVHAGELEAGRAGVVLGEKERSRSEMTTMAAAMREQHEGGRLGKPHHLPADGPAGILRDRVDAEEAPADPVLRLALEIALDDGVDAGEEEAGEAADDDPGERLDEGAEGEDGERADRRGQAEGLDMAEPLHEPRGQRRAGQHAGK